MLLASAAAAAIGGGVTPAVAQGDQVEKVTVTGSRIKQKGLVSQSPVTTIGDQVIRYQGSPDITATLNNLPAVNFAQDRTQGALADGTATVDLRAQGAARTLVLIDGQRLMPGDPLQANPAADLNMIPTSMVQRIEVVTGGASAVYGSDAMTGVVNFIMRRDFSGIQLDVTGGVHETGNDDPDHIRRLRDAGFSPPKQNLWDGQEFAADLIIGANTPDGRGNVTMYAGYQDVDGIFGGDRATTACAYAEDGAGDLFCLASSNFARIIPLDGYKADNGADDGDYFIGDPNWIGFDPNDGAQTFNFAPANLLQRPDTRFKAGAFAHYDIADTLEAYMSVMYFKDRSPVIAAPSGSFLNNGAVTINCDNPLMTDAQADLLGCMVTEGDLLSGRLTEDRTVILGRRNVEGGNRNTPLEHSQIRFAGGLRGDLAPGWDYDVYSVYGETNYTQTYFNDWSISRKGRALQVDPVTGNCKSFDSGIDPACVPLNIFNGLGGLSQGMIGYVAASPIITGDQRQTTIGGQVTGDLESLGIKSPQAETAVQVAAGLEYRRDALRFVPSADWAAADLEGNTQLYLLTNASLDVSEFFAETTIPLVEDRPFFKLLQLNAGYRVSDYSTSAGIVHTYKYGAEWAPSEDIRFRGSFQSATRAPGLLELFGPPGFALTPGFSDTCLNPLAVNRPTQAQCLNVGVSADAYNNATGGGDCISGQCALITGANPNLKSESAETLTYGFVFTPSFFKGFNLTVDYYKIDITDYIAAGINFNVIYGQCLTVGSLCDLILRDPQGELNEKGFGFDQRNLNIGQQIAEGIDIESTLRVDLEESGALSFAFIGTKQIDQIIIDVAEGELGKRDCVGFWGLTCGTPYFEWRHQMRASWSTPWDLELAFTWRHLSSVKLDANSTDPNLNGGGGAESLHLPSIPAFDYLDIGGRYSITENYELTFGMQNVFDKDPPSMSQDYSAGNALNTLNTNYDTLGRFMFVTGTVRY
jgi:iron complex outermembrane receptor protein